MSPNPAFLVPSLPCAPWRDGASVRRRTLGQRSQGRTPYVLSETLSQRKRKENERKKKERKTGKEETEIHKRVGKTSWQPKLAPSETPELKSEGTQASPAGFPVLFPLLGATECTGSF
ncbi:hypothetical protein AAY473_027432 [Plecturocebus cupreus]